MKVEEVMKLIDAGFSKDEIIEMENGRETPAEPVEQKEIETEKVEQPIDAMQSVFNEFIKSFKTVADEIKKSNIATSRMTEQPVESAEDILASIIAPPKKERGK